MIRKPAVFRGAGIFDGAVGFLCVTLSIYYTFLKLWEFKFGGLGA